MGPTDFNRFRAVMAGMSKLYDKEIDAVLLDAYWLALRDWRLEDFESAAGHLMANSEFMPRPAAFNALRKAGTPTAHEAWTRVLSGAQLEPGSVTERAANAMGGQQRIRMADIERDLPHIQRRFIEAYEGMTDAEAIREAVPQIANQPNWLIGTVRALEAGRPMVGHQRPASESLEPQTVGGGG